MTVDDAVILLVLLLAAFTVVTLLARRSRGPRGVDSLDVPPPRVAPPGSELDALNDFPDETPPPPRGGSGQACACCCHCPACRKGHP